MPQIVPLDGPSRLVVIPLEKPVITMGSRDDNDVVVKVSGVSRRHARLVRENGAWVLEDLDSSTCVLVDGKPVKRLVLTHRARFSLGDAAHFLYLESADPEYLASLGGGAPPVDQTAAAGRPRDLESLLEIGASINSSLEPAEVLESILAKAFTLTGAERGFIMLVEEGELVPRVSHNMGLDDETETSFSGSFARKVIEKNETIVSTNVAEDPCYRSASIVAHKIFAIMCAPLVAKGKPIGCLYVDRRRSMETFSSELVAIFTALAHQAALAIHNARMADDLRRSQRQLQVANLALKKSLSETEVLYEASRTLNEGQDVNTVLRTCLARARVLLRAERASMMLLDEKAQYLTTRLVEGAPLLLDPTLRLPMGQGIAGTVAQEGVGRITNLGAADPGFQEVVANRDKNVRELMCAPLKADNRCIGVINVSNRPAGDPFTEDDLNMLTSLASMAAVAIVKHRVDRERLQQVRLTKQVEDARQVQRLLLPRVLPSVSGFEFGAHYVPANKVGGDYYDFLSLDERRVGIVVADVSGHDIASSLIMVMGRNLVKIFSRIDPAPREVLARTSAMLSEDVKSQWYITMFYGVLDTRTRELTYANAGNQPPLVLRANGSFEELPTTGYPLGMMEGAIYEEGHLTLQEGDLLLVFTDGLVEAQDASKELYEMERFKESVSRRRREPLCAMVTGLHADVLGFTGGRTLQDDFTLVVVDTVAPKLALHVNFSSRLVDLPAQLSRLMAFATEEVRFKDTGDLFVALTAALNNAISHGNRFDPSRKIFVSASPSLAGLSVTVSDEGGGFDTGAELARPSAPGRQSGLARIRTSTTAVSFNAVGNAITMEFARP